MATFEELISEKEKLVRVGTEEMTVAFKEREEALNKVLELEDAPKKGDKKWQEAVKEAKSKFVKTLIIDDFINSNKDVALLGYESKVVAEIVKSLGGEKLLNQFAKISPAGKNVFNNICSQEELVKMFGENGKPLALNSSELYTKLCDSVYEKSKDIFNGKEKNVDDATKKVMAGIDNEIFWLVKNAGEGKNVLPLSGAEEKKLRNMVKDYCTANISKELLGGMKGPEGTNADPAFSRLQDNVMLGAENNPKTVAERKIQKFLSAKGYSAEEIAGITEGSKAKEIIKAGASVVEKTCELSPEKIVEKADKAEEVRVEANGEKAPKNLDTRIISKNVNYRANGKLYTRLKGIVEAWYSVIPSEGAIRKFAIANKNAANPKVKIPETGLTKSQEELDAELVAQNACIYAPRPTVEREEPAPKKSVAKASDYDMLMDEAEKYLDKYNKAMDRGAKDSELNDLMKKHKECKFAAQALEQEHAKQQEGKRLNDVLDNEMGID
ncbi:MAG: hypothetical protein LBG88_03570 [Christensenellaceae bacterium]|jgi:hypothetical protein|nr:hypothetical protein [Christensenellaceae bacterium]